MASIYENIGNIMKDLDAIKKDKRNNMQGFMFRGIDDVYNSLHPLLAKYGVFSVPTVLSEKTEERTTKKGSNLIYRILTIKYTFYSTDGTSLEAVVIGEGMDSGDKAANKAMAVGHKYALMQIFSIPTEDMVDPDSETPEPSTKNPVYINRQQALNITKTYGKEAIKIAMKEMGFEKLSDIKIADLVKFDTKIQDIQEGK